MHLYVGYITLWNNRNQNHNGNLIYFLSKWIPNDFLILLVKSRHDHPIHYIICMCKLCMYERISSFSWFYHCLNWNWYVVGRRMMFPSGYLIYHQRSWFFRWVSFFVRCVMCPSLSVWVQRFYFHSFQKAWCSLIANIGMEAKKNVEIK